ncbi:MAG: D-TA family PLP-dependent enzyme [Chitinophagaceae bacterium]|nr:D-TA family PLP-dependent enzyme [Chitinophagaceae bacterium]
MYWYRIDNIERIDTPCLVLYKERIKNNIARAIERVTDPANLRPHVKTNKIPEVCRMMMDAGVTKFKCATIAEAEMLAIINAPDVLFAYQPVGPKGERLLNLVIHYPDTKFSCIVDHISAVQELSKIFTSAGEELSVYIDLNTGMNRTGVAPADAYALLSGMQNLSGIRVEGLHAYDGHLTDPDPLARKEETDRAFGEIKKLAGHVENVLGRKIKIIAGGSPTFAAHASRNIECSPGTFVFWDWGYKRRFPEEPFEYAALVLTRIISVVNNNTITVDLGHKAIASENPIQSRVHFLNAPDARPVSHSEEHMVLNVPDAAGYKPGDVLYGVPAHVCPTIALYERAVLIENAQATTLWRVSARDRKINF